MRSSAETVVAGKKFAFVVNPTSGNADKIDLESIMSAVRDAGHQASLQVTSAQGDAQITLGVHLTAHRAQRGPASSRSAFCSEFDVVWAQASTQIP